MHGGWGAARWIHHGECEPGALNHRPSGWRRSAEFRGFSCGDATADSSESRLCYGCAVSGVPGCLLGQRRGDMGASSRVVILQVVAAANACCIDDGVYVFSLSRAGNNTTNLKSPPNLRSTRASLSKPGVDPCCVTCKRD
jgi:hypothetical protein